MTGQVLSIRGLLFTALALSVSASGHAETSKQVFVTLTSAEVQTQGMALVLSTAMQAQGAHVELLLCDQAGELAVSGSPETHLAPRDVSPQMMLKNLMQNGASVQVCALFLPNKELNEGALLNGVTSANPRDIAERLVADDVRVFNF